MNDGVDYYDNYDAHDDDYENDDSWRQLRLWWSNPGVHDNDHVMINDGDDNGVLSVNLCRVYYLQNKLAMAPKW